MMRFAPFQQEASPKFIILRKGAVRKRSVIANQRARWCGTPRVFPSGTIPRIFKHLGRKTKLFPSNRGAATPVTSVTGSQRHTFLTAPFYISPRNVSTSLRMSRGLLRWAFMPALRERRTSSSKALAVRATMGKASVSGRWRARMAWAAS